MRGLSLFLMLMLTPAFAACTYFAHSKAVDYYDSGRARDERGDSDGAIADYTKAIEADPTFVKAYLDRGIVRKKKDDYNGAVADFTKVIKLDPKNLQAYMSRGSARIFTEDLDGAVEDFTKAIELDTRKAMQAVNYRNRAAAYSVQKKFDLAAADERKAAEIEKQP
ncbi:MAG TPA: tetratricopeptide repeat protein [Pyrinomonadaceae bacterium]|nr:tetratricopeptide repeat protein [Pyrinomonadaceae bacterium]